MYFRISSAKVNSMSSSVESGFQVREGTFGCDIDYAMLIKTYESSREETRYSPAVCTSCERKTVMGRPDPDHISTCDVERQRSSLLHAQWWGSYGNNLAMLSQLLYNNAS